MVLSDSAKQIITKFIISITSTIDAKIHNHNDSHGSSANFGHTKAGGVPKNVSSVASAGTDNGYYARADHVHKASYNDLSDKPTIPTTTSQLTNNSGFLTSHQDISGKEDISNKVRTWSSSPKDTRYPSERLVKDSLDNKANYGHKHTKSDITDFLNAVYPIGSIYMSVNSTSPSTLFGGTWQRLEDTFLYATSGTADTGYQATGGESTHTLSVNEMPAHNHTQNAHNHNPNASWDFLLGQTGVNWASTGGKGSISGSGSNHYMYTSSSKSDVGQLHSTSNATPTINNTGGGQAHNNMPPYMNVYMWKRTQ